MKVLKSYLMPLLLLIGIIAGAIVGLVMGEEASFLKPVGNLFLNLIFCIIVPLVFFTVSSAIANMEGGKRLGKIIKGLIITFAFTSVIAAVYMYGVLSIFDPTEGIQIELEKPESTEEAGNWADQLVATLTVGSFTDLLDRGNLLAIIIMSILVGAATKATGEKGLAMRNFLNAGSEIMVKLINYIMYIAPLGLGAYMATLIGDYGSILLGSYLKAGVAYYVGALVYFFIAFSIYAFIAGRRLGFKTFWKNMFQPSITALATCSSAAAMPVNLEATRRMGVAEDIRKTVIALGTSLHKDGSVMGGVLKLFFAFSIFGLSTDGTASFFKIVGMALIVGVVMGAIQGGGMIAEVLILSMFGLPVEALPILAAIATLIDPPATLLNASGDNVCAMMINRYVEGKDWLKNKIKGNQVQA